MAEPDWRAWEQILRSLQADMGDVKATLAQHGSKLSAIEDEVKGLKRMAQMALGTASGADFVAERAEQLAKDTNKRLDALITALHEKDIHVDA